MLAQRQCDSLLVPPNCLVLLPLEPIPNLELFLLPDCTVVETEDRYFCSTGRDDELRGMRREQCLKRDCVDEAEGDQLVSESMDRKSEKSALTSDINPSSL